MAYFYTKAPILSLFLFSSIVLAFTQTTIADNKVPSTAADIQQQPQWFIGHNGGTVIPGVGPIGQNHGPFLGGTPFPRNAPSGSGMARGYIPGGDDTFVPNPGFEVPNPGHGRVPAANAP